MKTLKVTTKLYLALIGIAVIMLIFVIYSSTQHRSITEKYEEVISTYDAAASNLAGANANYLQVGILSSNLAKTEKVTKEECEKVLAEVEEISAKAEKRLDYVRKMITEGDLKNQLDELNDLIEEQSEVGNRMMENVMNGKLSDARTVCDTEFVPLANEIGQLTDEMCEACKTITSSYATEAYNKRVVAERVSVVFIILMFVITIAFSVNVVRDIRLPLSEIIEVLKDLSQGDVNVSVKKYKDNEFGVLTDQINALAAKNQRAADIAKKISVGDLTMFVNPESASDVLGQAFKLLVDKNNGILGDIHEATVQVGTGSRQVAVASQSLAQGATEQASALEQVTASIDDITEKTKLNAENASQANTLVRETKDNAEEGNREMALMVNAMKDINESSENISKIIKTIDDIAFQTNILALNAAVEAARAGEHGKGFAVVAEEVRSLAAKSAEAASETAEMIEDSIQKVQNGSELAERTAGMLSEIGRAVDNIVTLIDGIAIASTEQTSALLQIDQAINQVSQVVQTNSATSEQCAAASEELSNQAKNLEILVGKYQLRAGKDSNSYLDGNVSDSFGVSGYSIPDLSDNDFGNSAYTGSSTIPDASDFAGMTNEAQNEQIISLEDNTYSKY